MVCPVVIVSLKTPARRLFQQSHGITDSIVGILVWDGFMIVLCRYVHVVIFPIVTFSLSSRGSPASLKASCSRGGTLADMITFSLLMLYNVRVQFVWNLLNLLCK